MQKKRMIYSGVVICFFLTLVTITYSQENDVDIPLMGEESFDITPPFPVDDSKTQRYNLTLELRDYNTKELIKDINANVKTLNKNSKEVYNTLIYVGSNGRIRLILDRGEWSIIMKTDDINTEGKDNLIQKEFSVAQNIYKTVFLMPVGSALIKVVDDLGNPVRYAVVNIQCSAEYGELSLIKTDSSGYSLVSWIPVGTCIASAEYDKMVGSQRIHIDKGKLTYSEIKLTKKMAGKSIKWFIIILLILLSLGIFFLLMNNFFIWRSPVKLNSNNTVKEDIVQSNSRSEDILGTLRDNEKSVVDFLLKNKHVSYQASIRHNTNIPRTSLSRVLKSLESKRIVSVEKHGKSVRVKLTDWFLGK